MSQIKIMHVIDTGGPGGAESVFLNIVSGLDKSKFQSIPVIPYKDWLYNKLEEKNHKPIIIDSKGSFNIQYLYQMLKVARENKVDIIHSHLFGSNVYSCLLSALTRIPVITTFHGFVDLSNRSMIYKIKILIINRLANAITYVSEQLKNHYISKEGFNSSKSLVIYNGITKSNKIVKTGFNLKERLGIPADSIIIGSVGNIRPAKGYDTLLKAAEITRKYRTDIKYIIIGGASSDIMEEMENKKNDMELNETVYFLGFIDNPEKYYSNFDIFLLPSHSEGFSLSLVEAISNKLPIIATNSGGPKEIFHLLNMKGLVSPNSPIELADHILQNVEIDKLSLLKQQSAEASNLLGDYFSIDRMVQEYTKLYLSHIIR
ncbi:MAG: glycosyltransferase family 4 protein [Candidatus Thiodiazotropha sp.]